MLNFELTEKGLGLILTNPTLVGTFLGIILAGAFTYYDLWNNKNIPTPLVYLGFAISFVYLLLFYSKSPNILTHILLMMGFVLGGILFSKIGALGEADIWLFASLWNLIPTCTLSGLDMPSIIPLAGLSAILSIVILFPIFMLKLYKYKPKITYKSMLVFFIYTLLAFLIIPFANLQTATLLLVLGLISAIFSAYESHFKDITIEQIKLKDISNGDVVELDKYPKRQINGIDLPKVLDDKTLELLKDKHINKLWIYSKLPPYTPFILIGFVAMMIMCFIGT